MLKNKRQDEQQHQKYREIFRKDVPKKLEDFQKMKYNEPEKWNGLRTYERPKEETRVRYF